MSNKKINKVSSGFTLTEVLMTLLIIGLVAAMTIPSLITNQQEQSAISKLKKTYSVVSQAINISEATNSSINTWAFPSAGNVAELRSWFDTYFGPYLKYIIITEKANSIIVTLQDGIDVEFEMTSEMDVKIYINGYRRSNLVGKSIFYYEILPNTSNSAFRPYEEGVTAVGRAKWTTGPYACTRTNATANRRYCSGLIIEDDWEIKGDYPW